MFSFKILGWNRMLITEIVPIKNVIRDDFLLHIRGEIMINITKNTSMKNLY